MTMRSPNAPSMAGSRLTLAALALAAVAASGSLLTATTSENAIRKSFVAALETSASAKAAPRAGSEEYWLSALRPDYPAPLTKTVAVGDRIVMTLSGEKRTFEVASVAEFTPEITAVAAASAPSRFVLVTAKDVDDKQAKPIRFVMEIEGEPASVATRRTDRAL